MQTTTTTWKKLVIQEILGMHLSQWYANWSWMYRTTLNVKVLSIHNSRNSKCSAKLVNVNNKQTADVYDIKNVINRENFSELFGNSKDEKVFEGFRVLIYPYENVL